MQFSPWFFHSLQQENYYNLPIVIMVEKNTVLIIYKTAKNTSLTIDRKIRARRPFLRICAIPDRHFV